MKRIAIFASGSGSNAENIANYFNNNDSVEISLILTNNSNAFVLERAKKLSIPSLIFNKSEFTASDKIVRQLQDNNIDLVVLAGFLWMVPKNLNKTYPNKIVNIHPASLPNYGRKGMFDNKVHNDVIKNKKKESDITIHYVNEKYDEGEIIFQAKCSIKPSDNADDLAKNIHALEYEHFPKTLNSLLNKM